MGTNRKIVSRPSRGSVGRPVLEMFRELEAKKVDHWDDRSHELARRLNLVDWWWSGCGVLDRTLKPPSPTLHAHEGWHICRKIRNQLLKVLEEEPR